MSPDPTTSSRPQRGSGRPAPLIYAHRGAQDVAPENTLAAFSQALSVGADGFELDVTRCKSGEIVVIHDDTVDRTTNGTGEVHALTLGELRALDAGSWFDAAFRGERIPLLSEALDLLGKKSRINVEIKGGQARGDRIERDVLDMVCERGLVTQTIISSFDPMILYRAKRTKPSVPCGLLYAPNMPRPLSQAWSRRAIRCDALHPHYSQLTSESVSRLHRAGYAINVWTVNEVEDMRRMVDWGVDAIITDHIVALQTVLAP